MSGALGLSTPWARQYLADPLARERVRARVPDGCTLGVSAQRRPGDWTIWLVRNGDPVERLWSMRVRLLDLERACLWALRAHESKVVVTTDADGYIESMEDVP